jgi:hypothetical protein
MKKTTTAHGQHPIPTHPTPKLYTIQFGVIAPPSNNDIERILKSQNPKDRTRTDNAETIKIQPLHHHQNSWKIPTWHHTVRRCVSRESELKLHDR